MWNCYRFYDDDQPSKEYFYKKRLSLIHNSLIEVEKWMFLNEKIYTMKTRKLKHIYPFRNQLSHYNTFHLLSLLSEMMLFQLSILHSHIMELIIPLVMRYYQIYWDLFLLSHARIKKKILVHKLLIHLIMLKTSCMLMRI